MALNELKINTGSVQFHWRCYSNAKYTQYHKLRKKNYFLLKESQNPEPNLPSGVQAEIARYSLHAYLSANPKLQTALEEVSDTYFQLWIPSVQIKKVSDSFPDGWFIVRKSIQ